VVATLICGDNFLNDARDNALAAIIRMLQDLKPDIVIAGPAFESGRYGLACAEACKAAQGIGIPALTGMHPDNPGVESGRPDLLIVPTSASPVEMQAALAAMARLAIKLARKEPLGPAEVEGFLPRGVRSIYTRTAPGYRRALDMLKANCWAVIYHRGADSGPRTRLARIAHLPISPKPPSPRHHRRTCPQGEPR